MPMVSCRSTAAGWSEHCSSEDSSNSARSKSSARCNWKSTPPATAASSNASSTISRQRPSAPVKHRYCCPQRLSGSSSAESCRSPASNSKAHSCSSTTPTRFESASMRHSKPLMHCSSASTVLSPSSRETTPDSSSTLALT